MVLGEPMWALSRPQHCARPLSMLFEHETLVNFVNFADAVWGGEEVKVILTTAALIFSAAVVFCCTLTSRPWVLSSLFRVESALHCRFMARSYQKLTKLLTHPDITRKLSKLRQIFTVCVFFWFESLLKVNSSKMGHYPEALLDGDCA